MGHFLQKQGYRIKVFNSVDFTKSMHYNPIAYLKTESDILKFINALITNTKGDGKEGDEFWTKAETLLYCALVAYIVFEGKPEDKNINTLVDIIVCLAIYAVLIRSIAAAGGTDIFETIWTAIGCTVLLCFTLLKTGSLAKAVFGAH